MTGSASELARRLGEHAEAVCREYLSNGRRSGNHWIVGDVRNARGRSMHVRLRTNAKGLAGKWVDEASGEHGDLLDVIKESCSLVEFCEVARCRVKGRDLALEMLRVGWARVATPHPVDPAYLARQQHAMAARYGMWGTYVLDMNEWRRKAIDTTLSRRPIADFNLLTERESEISPPFVDARRKPKRTDR